MSHPITQYQKPAAPLADLLTHLANKGLVIPSLPAAEQTLKRIPYYRLLIYTRPFQDHHTKRFHQGTTIDNVIALYEFDRQLRLLCLDAIERIEVALRAALNNALTVQHGAHFYLESRHYNKREGFMEFMKVAATARYLGIDHYNQYYNTPPYPPLWIMLEAVSFGALSKLYSNLHLNNQKQVAAELGFHHEMLASWFKSLNVLRNMCAHHSRLWNFDMRVNMPRLPRSGPQPQPHASSFCARAIVIGELMKNIEPSSNWRRRMKDLILQNPIAQPGLMGFPTGWDQDPFWN